MATWWSRWNQNWLAAAQTSLTASAETSTEPVANVVDQTLARTWRIPALSAFLEADCTVPRTFRIFGLFGLRNATPELTFRIRLSNVAAGNDEVWDSGVLVTGIERGFDQYVLVASAEWVARYVRLDIADTGSDQDYLTVGMAWAGAALELPNPDLGLTFGHDDPSPGRATPGGQSYIEEKRLVRYCAGAYGGLPPGLAMGDGMDLLRAGAAETCLFAADPSDPKAQRKAVAGLLTKRNATLRLAADRNRIDFEIRERL